MSLLAGANNDWGYGFLQLPPHNGHHRLALRFAHYGPREDLLILKRNLPGTQRKGTRLSAASQKIEQGVEYDVVSTSLAVGR